MAGSTDDADYRVPAILLGSGVTVLGALRSLARRSIPTYVLGERQDIETHSRWYAPAPLARGERADPSRLEAVLRNLPWERAVLISCTDAWSRAVARLRPDLAARFPSSQPSPAIIATLTDKGRTAEVTERLGITHPHTIVLSSARDLERLPDEYFARAFLKPRDSEAFYGRHGRKAVMVKDRADAVRKFAEYEKEGFGFVLQEYVPGPVTSHYFVDGYVDRQGRTTAQFARQRLRMWPFDFGNSSCTMSVPGQEVAEGAALLNRLLRNLDYHGIFSAEFKVDERTGRFNLLEVNTRPWWYVGFAAACKVDVCRLAYQDALGLPQDPVPAYPTGRRCVYLPSDWPACLELYRTGRLSLVDWLRSWIPVRTLVHAWDDPLPGMSNLANLTAEMLSRRLRRRQPARKPPVPRHPAGSESRHSS